MKKVIYFLALWFLLDWAFFNKIKPFMISQFGQDSTRKEHGNILVNTGNDFVNTGAYAYGLDISHYQGKETRIPFQKKDSISFIICKATEGKKGQDINFRQNWKEIATNGFIRGAYHFYLSKEDPVLQANNFLKVVGPFLDYDFPPIIDIEDSLTDNGQLLRFLSIVQNATNRTPVIYTDYDIGQRYLNDAAFAKYPLWFAHYSNYQPAVLPGVWKG